MSRGGDRTLEAVARGFVALPGDTGRPCDIVLRYHAEDPLVVSLSARSVCPALRLIVPREVLTAGLGEVVETGAVTVWPVLEPDRPPTVQLQVRGVRGGARMELSFQALLVYLEHSHALVPFGEETQPGWIDAALARFLDTEAGSGRGRLPGR
ncbi:SsgA family sporulation/cell division regulator [Streptomyces sp. NPDC059524]|uniref:SsgA family sporulation/cell division regulator n=1 Tax=Streptomyces sp. NPDC059524 TaxID=3346856 RepID=UPI0036A16DAC